MKPLMFTLNAPPSLEREMAADGAVEIGSIEHRHFPDGESYIRLETPVDGRAVILLCSLDSPDERLMPLLLAGDAARQQGAQQVGLIAPYLAYMRQDRAFRSGEAVSATSFAAILSRHFDWLVTLEPHLHRIDRLADVFSIPARAAKATAPIADWIAGNVEKPFLIGPDSESAPWVERIAGRVGAPHTVLAKTRLGDRDVRIEGSLDELREGMTPVVVDDIVSSGGTMTQIIQRVAQHTDRPATYIAVHALAESLPQEVSSSPALGRFVSCNSVSHASNAIDIGGPLMIEAMDLIGHITARHLL